MKTLKQYIASLTCYTVRTEVDEHFCVSVSKKGIKELCEKNPTSMGYDGNRLDITLLPNYTASYDSGDVLVHNGKTKTPDLAVCTDEVWEQIGKLKQGVIE